MGRKTKVSKNKNASSKSLKPIKKSDHIPKIDNRGCEFGPKPASMKLGSFGKNWSMRSVGRLLGRKEHPWSPRKTLAFIRSIEQRQRIKLLVHTHNRYWLSPLGMLKLMKLFSKDNGAWDWFSGRLDEEV